MLFDRVWIRLPILVGLMVAACSSPPAPSGESDVPDEWLLTADDLDGDFSEQYRGQATEGGGAVCPESRFRTEDHSSIRAEFVRAESRAPRVTVTEAVWRIAAADPAAWFDELATAYADCDQVVWTDYGDTKTIRLVSAVTSVADRLAFRVVHGEPPFDGAREEERVVVTRVGDLVVEIQVAESFEGSEEPLIDDQQLLTIVERAIDEIAPATD